MIRAGIQFSDFGRIPNRGAFSSDWFCIRSLAAPAASATVVWRQASDDVHVATVHGEFAGFIAEGFGRYTAHDAHSRPLFITATRSEARVALETFHRSAASPRVLR